MRVRQIPVTGTWTIYAACSERGDCHLLNFLTDLDDGYKSSVEGLFALFEHVAENGLPRHSNWCHQLRDDIWEFRKGKIRVLYFCRGGKVIVCTHGLVKSTQRIKNADIDHAEGVFKAYCEALQKDEVQVERENGE